MHIIRSVKSISIFCIRSLTIIIMRLITDAPLAFIYSFEAGTFITYASNKVVNCQKGLPGATQVCAVGEPLAGMAYS